ncbi:hypothetical protein CEQ90_07460 [Lewinellaceae bacterium SD302]|nr:hypothetical protein CEQ90_07460 [Lewinellaceae bacterium SD302]
MAEAFCERLDKTDGCRGKPGFKCAQFRFDWGSWISQVKAECSFPISTALIIIKGEKEIL